uniref:Cysteine sulfinic acid decarboxylase n=1 Tax=Timema genevievae TaxID=629358 RepID=A0A7R9JX35_TIMGE|nr:unnamed protein product [Timema genevievae]
MFLAVPCSPPSRPLLTSCHHSRHPRLSTKIVVLCGTRACQTGPGTRGLLRSILDLILDEAVFEGTSRNNRVVEWKSPEELDQVVELGVSAEPLGHDKLLRLVRDTIRYSVKTGHPYFVNQLFSSVDPYGLAGQWLGDALNPSLYTYEVAPVFSLMEEIVLKEMRKLVGFPDGQGDGIFCPGGSVANGYAISCARHHLVPEIKTQGLHGLPRLVLYTSEDAHYSVKKMASFMGLGSDNVYLVKCDSRGKMNTTHLQEQIQRTLDEGARPFMVSATAGTTVLGAFDPLSSISTICKKYGLWFHVDAAWGGGALFSQQHKHLLDGIHRADSVTWNPHKLLTAPQQCSTLLLRHQGVLSSCHSTSAQYLFQKDKFYNVKFDTGDKHIQCGRRVDVLKFWFMWKAKTRVGRKKVGECVPATLVAVERKDVTATGALVTDGFDNMDCGAVQAVERVVGVACASAEERDKGLTQQ